MPSSNQDASFEIFYNEEVSIEEIEYISTVKYFSGINSRYTTQNTPLNQETISTYHLHCYHHHYHQHCHHKWLQASALNRTWRNLQLTAYMNLFSISANRLLFHTWGHFLKSAETLAAITARWPCGWLPALSNMFAWGRGMVACGIWIHLCSSPRYSTMLSNPLTWQI